MLFAAGRAAGKVSPEPRECGIGVTAGELGFDVPVELVESLVAANLGGRRPEEVVQLRAAFIGCHCASSR